MRRHLVQTRVRARVIVAITLLLHISSPARVLAAPGDLDPTFDGDGKVTTDFGGLINDANAVAVQPDGKILVAGCSRCYADFLLVRYNPNGSIDTGFGINGFVTLGESHVAQAIALQPDGKIVVAGDRGFFLARFNSNGALDSSFDGDGKVTAGIGDFAAALALQPNGKIVVGGGSTFVSAVARFNPNGSLDSTFDNDGVVMNSFGGAAFAVALQPDGKIIAAGTDYPSDSLAVARLNQDGSLDSTFDNDGVVTTDFDPFSIDGARALAVQPDGKIVAAGCGPCFTELALARYNADGTPDQTFDADGKVTTPDFGGASTVAAFDLALTSNGKMVVVAGAGFPEDFAVARYMSGGTLDTGFGNGGAVLTDFASNGDRANALAIQPDGKIIAAGGTFSASAGFDIALVRYEGRSVLCRGLEATIVGAPFADNLIGTPGDDVIVTNDGNDSVSAGLGNDTICTENGNDSVDAGGGNDVVDAGGGIDTVLGGIGNDSLHGGVSSDLLYGGSGSDLVRGNGQDDLIVGGRGNDTLIGNAGVDTANGSIGFDRCLAEIESNSER